MGADSFSVNSSMDKVYQNTLEWYKTADNKAQVILSINGIILSLFSGTIFGKQPDILETLRKFDNFMWVLLLLSAAFVVCSILSALFCLLSRMSVKTNVKDKLSDRSIKYFEEDPELFIFFGTIAEIDQARSKDFVNNIFQFTEERFTKALAGQIFLLSKNVKQKHRWINKGFTFFSCGLISFIILVTIYLLKIAE